MRRKGYKIVGVSTSKGGLYNKNGIDIEALLLHHERNRTLNGFPDAEGMSSAELLVADCDILIPAAFENQITSRNAAQVKAKILCEGANGPTTAEADEILVDKGVFVIPDILANSGGVTVSYFEWVQDRQGYFWTEPVVNDHLKHTMRTAFAEVLKYAETHGVSNRIAAYMLAVGPRRLYAAAARNLRIKTGLVDEAIPVMAANRECGGTRIRLAAGSIAHRMGGRGSLFRSALRHVAAKPDRVRLRDRDAGNAAGFPRAR